MINKFVSCSDIYSSRIDFVTLLQKFAQQIHKTLQTFTYKFFYNYFHNFLIFPIANSLKFSFFRITSAFQYFHPTISQLCDFQFSYLVRREKIISRIKKTNPPLPPQFSLNFHFNFPSTLPAPLVKSVGKSNDDETIGESTAESGYLIMIRTLFKTIVPSERIKVWPDRLFPSHPVCTRLSVKLLIGVHASPREGREGREEATLTVILEDFLPSGGV